MILGAYWSARQEGIETAAGRVSQVLMALRAISSDLSRWYPKGATASAAREQELTSLSVESITPHLTSNRSDVDGGVIPRLGWHIALWNGDGVSFSAIVGLYAPRQSNSAVLRFSARSRTPTLDDQRAILESMIRALDPDQAVATSDELLDRAGATRASQVGWLMYERGHGLRVTRV